MNAGYLQSPNGFIEIGIEKDDVTNVAFNMGITTPLSEEQIDTIFDVYQQAETEYPDVRWDILMAQCINYVLNK